MSNPAATGIAALRDDSLPPLSVPLRFFLTAPWFLVLTGTLWLWQGSDALAARWTPGLLASTHLITLGFFTMIMFGALFQVVPVLGGTPIRRPRLVGGVTHIALAGGALLLSVGLWTLSPAWLQAALLLLLTAFAAFVPPLARALLPAAAAALRPLRFAALAFVATIVLGVVLAIALAWPDLGIAHRRWTDLHAAWGGLGWGLLLVIGVGHQVIPMFHVTPAYPAALTRRTVPIAVIGLVLLALPAPLPMLGMIALGLAGLAHVAVTLVLLAHRRRRRADATVLAWQCGLPCVAAALLLALLDAVVPEIMRPSAWLPSFELLLAVLFAFGGLGTIVLGMLTKIVPFLAFLHLQRRSLPALAAMRELPPMEDILGQRAARTQVVLHLTTAAATFTAVLSPALTALAGALLIGDGLCCFLLLTTAARRYGRARQAVDRALAAAV